MSARARAAVLVLLALAGAGSCRSRRHLAISGTITLASGLQSKAPKTNGVLFIVVKNSGGVPVAVKRLVNPEFPLSFSLKEEDLIVPGEPLAGPLTLFVQMNAHGRVGDAQKGDLESQIHHPVDSTERGVHVAIDMEVH